ncbi:MAG: nodulation protein NfeD [Syntrophobacteraceae bacterium]|nr:nodulation protein NfeD [Syntrophobacteraceae bacterium]
MKAGEVEMTSRKKTIIRSLCLAFAALGFLSLAAGVKSEADTGHYNVIKVQDTINPGVEDFIEYAIQTSEKDEAKLLIILLDTPGGLLTATRGIAQALLNASIPIVVFIYPSGAQAASAGVFITAAADIAAMAPGTNIGAAHPVTTGGADVPSTMSEKVLNDTVAFGRSIADQRGRNADWYEQAIRKSVSITAQQAFTQNVIDLVADDLPALLKRLDGWELERKGRKTTLSTLGLEERTISPGWQHAVLRVISNPNIAYLLLMIGLAGLYFELSQPGAILPGVIGGISLILALYAMQTLPVNYAGFLLILLAILFFLLEIKVASYGMLSFAGVISLILGSLMLFRVPGATTRLAMSVFIPTVLVVSAFFAAVAAIAFRAQIRKPQTGADGLVGALGEVMNDLDLHGKVFVSGELWNAVADEKIIAGEKVEVLSVENLKLKVKKIGAK